MFRPFVVWCLVTCCGFVLGSQCFGKSDKAKVVYLSSYNLGYDWTDLVTDGIFSVFDAEKNVEVFAEFLDAKRYPLGSVEELFWANLQVKYADDGIDALLCSDNAVLDLILARRDDPLLLGVPIVFCGITNTEDYEQFPELYGVKEEHEFEKLVSAIHRIVPRVKRLNIVLNNTATGRLYRDLFLKFESRWEGELEFVFYLENSVGEIAETFGRLGTGDAIYATVVTVGKNGEAIHNELFMQELVRRSPVPVFGDLMAYGSSGMLGGQTNNAKGQGAMSARMVLDLLEEKVVEPKVVNPDIEWRFDYEVIQRFGLDSDLFPENARIDNVPDDVFQKYKREIITAGVVFVLLFCTVFLLSTLLVQKRRHEKEILAEKARAEESDRLKSVFLANISHEIRTPLNAMIGLSTIMQMDTNLDEEAQENADQIVDSGFALRDTITNILEYSRIESGDTEPIKEEYPFSEVLNRLWSFEHWATVNTKRVDLDNQISEDRVCCLDIRMAQQVLGQALHNALKFSGESRVRIGCREESGVGVFTIEDDGCGIAPVDRNIVFKPFAKGTQTENAFHPGAGLGLSIAKEYAEKLGGKISLEFEGVEGTRAVVRFPLG